MNWGRQNKIIRRNKTAKCWLVNYILVQNLMNQQAEYSCVMVQEEEQHWVDSPAMDLDDMNMIIDRQWPWPGYWAK